MPRNPALYEPPYSTYAATNPTIQQLQERGYAVSAHEATEHPPLSARNFPGHDEVELGPLFGYVRHPLSEDRMAWIGHVLCYDPSRFQVAIEAVEEGDGKPTRESLWQAMKDHGYMIMPTSDDRVVGIKPIDGSEPSSVE